MAVLIIYAQPSKIPGNAKCYDEGDVVDVLEDGQGPGLKIEIDPRFAFIKVPGTRDEWTHLKEEYHLQALDADGFLNNVEMLARRKKMVKTLEDAPTKSDALDWAKTPVKTKSEVDADTVDKSKPPKEEKK